jgi:hypothetical protein
VLVQYNNSSPPSLQLRGVNDHLFKEDKKSTVKSAVHQTCTASWYSYHTTFNLMLEVLSVERSLLVQYARRCLVSVFEHWPRTQPLTSFIDGPALVHTLHMALQLDHSPLTELHPEKKATETRDFRKSLLRALLIDYQRALFVRATAQSPVTGSDVSMGSGYLAGIMQKDVISLLEMLAVDKKPGGTSKGPNAMRVIKAPVRSRRGRGEEGVALEMTGTGSALHVTIEVDPKLINNLGQVAVDFYRRPDSRSLIQRVQFTWGQTDKQRVSLAGQKVWYTVSSTGYARGTNVKGEVTMRVRLGSTQDAAFDGDLNSALLFTDVLMSTKQPDAVVQQLLLLLLRSLPYQTDRKLAQRLCRSAARVFAHWNDNHPPGAPELQPAPKVEKKEDKKDDKPEEEVEEPFVAGPKAIAEIESLVTSMERAHAALRAATLLAWNGGSAPGTHLQAMLELVLAARRAIPPQTVQAQMKNSSTPEYVLEAYKHRDGAPLCQVVDVVKRRMLKNMSGLGESSSGFDYTGAVQCYIANACVKGGGKFYYEVKLVDRPQMVTKRSLLFSFSFRLSTSHLFSVNDLITGVYRLGDSRLPNDEQPRYAERYEWQRVVCVWPQLSVHAPPPQHAPEQHVERRFRVLLRQ